MDCQKVCTRNAECEFSAISSPRLPKITQKSPASIKLAASKITGRQFTARNNTRKITLISHTSPCRPLHSDMLAVKLPVPFPSTLHFHRSVAKAGNSQACLGQDFNPWLVFKWSCRALSICNCPSTRKRNTLDDHSLEALTKWGFVNVHMYFTPFLAHSGMLGICCLQRGATFFQ